MIRNNLRSIKSLAMVIVLVLAAVTFSARPVQPSGGCPAPGTGLQGALNMLLDDTMWTVAMVHSAQQGYDGMFTAVYSSACHQ